MSGSDGGSVAIFAAASTALGGEPTNLFRTLVFPERTFRSPHQEIAICDSSVHCCALPDPGSDAASQRSLPLQRPACRTPAHRLIQRGSFVRLSWRDKPEPRRTVGESCSAFTNSGFLSLSGLLLNITPGPDTAYIVGRSLQLGWRGGVVAALGIGAGCLVHVFAAAIGLSALLAASSAAFALVKWAGAAYLCLLGARMLLARLRRLGCCICIGSGGGNRHDFASPGILAGRADQCAEPEGSVILSGFPAAIRGRGFAAQGCRLCTARLDLCLQWHALVPWCRVVRRERRRPYPTIRSSLRLDQSRAGRPVRLSRHPRRDGSVALKLPKRYGQLRRF